MLSDSELLVLLQSERNAFQDKALLALYKRNLGIIRNYALKNNGSEEDAEELLQDALVAVFMNVRKQGFQLTAKLDTYLYSIAKNIWYKKLRKIKRQPQFVVMDHPENELTNYVDEIVLKEESPMVQMIKRMGGRCVEILTMIYLRELGIKEIKESLGYQSEQAVRNKKSSCLSKLREQFRAGKLSRKDIL